MSRRLKWLVEQMNFTFMCYHKSLVEKYNSLMEHYSASFASITAEMELIKEKYDGFVAQTNELVPMTKEEVRQGDRLRKTLKAFTKTGIERYHENGYDHLPTPIITAGAPGEFRMFNWG